MSPFRRSWPDRISSFTRELVAKAAADNVFFLASGLTFNLLLAAIPFLVLLAAVAGVLLEPHITAPASTVLDRLWQLVPAAGSGTPAELRERLGEAVEAAGSVGVVSGVLFAWFSTRLFGSLRAVLSEVFDVRGGLGVVRGKLADFGMVAVSTALLSVNVALTSAATGVGDRILGAFGLQVVPLSALFSWVAGVVFVFVMFLLIFKFVPARSLRWRTAVSAALVATAGFELMKLAFGWYLTNVADFQAVFTAFVTPVVFVISLYYAAVIFILAGEASQVLQERRRMRLQRAVLD